ncbi:MAG: 30S ribosomal protein S16 [Candidatus Margulisiibacteriota bacterium]
MSAKIRLLRLGTRGKPFYRVVVMDESSARNSKTIEILGTYDPRKEPASFEVSKEKVEAWLKKGALPTDTVRKYLGKAGILSPVNFDKAKKRAPKKEVSAAEATPSA